MQKKSLIIALFSISVCFALTEPDLSNRIIIDGFSDDFTNDEGILSDSLGNLLESPADSYWGKYNDVKQIKVTWDESYLYLAVDACSWDNNVMLFIDIYDDYGIEDMSELNAWKRSFKFYNCNPDFFVGTWDLHDKPEFRKIQEGGSMKVEPVDYTVETSATFDTDNLDGAMEIKILWKTLFYSENRQLQDYPKIKLVTVITGSSDFSSGPDCAPDNLGGMTNDSGQMVVIDNYAEIYIDADADGNPDMNVEPQKQTKFLSNPTLPPTPILIQDVIFTNGKTFAPTLNEEIYFELATNRTSEFTVEIFDLNGKFINYAENTEPLSWKWNGKNENENFVPFGIYILRFIADSGEVSNKKAVVVIN